MYKKYLVKKFYFDEKRVYSFENELQEVIDKCENSLILKNQIITHPFLLGSKLIQLLCKVI